MASKSRKTTQPAPVPESSRFNWIYPALLAILILGGALRLYNVNWDGGYHLNQEKSFHLHPDERYLTMVANDIRWPRSWAEYFDVRISPLSPYNYQQFKNYLYGTLPVFATKYAAGRIRNPQYSNLPPTHDNYEQLNLVGRRISAILDTLSILLIFLIARRLFARASDGLRDKAALAAALCYALCVSAIQNAHFFTMESWLVLFTLLTFYLATLLVRSTSPQPRWRTLLLLALTGVSLGLTLASKVNGIFIVIPILIALAGRVNRTESTALGKSVLKVGGALLLILGIAYLVFRFFTPYAFANSSWLSVTPNANFKAALDQQRDAVNGVGGLAPPSYQWWLSTLLVTPLKNVVVWGLGLPLGLTALAGFVALGVAVVARFLKREVTDAAQHTVGLMLLTFVLISFLYAGSRFGHTVRYLVPILPFLCLSAVCGLVHLREKSPVLARRVTYGVLLLTGLYAAAFTSIYRQPMTRVAATEWIAQRVPQGSQIIFEYWDDPLPLGVPGYQGIQLNVFDPDDTMKLEKLYNGLADAEYYGLSSPRAWRTVGLLPDRFPFMARFYKLLFEGKLGYEKVAEFTSYPQLFGITIPDITAEETFWVYDHPPVIILQKTKTITREEFESFFADLKGKEVPDPAHPH